MTALSPRGRAALSALVLSGLVVPAGSAHAEVVCGADPHEKDTVTTAAPLAVGTTVTRAICQEPTPQPRYENARDDDFFVFTASGRTAYTVQAVDVGPALVNDEFDRGGLELGLSRLNADGSTTRIDQNRGLNGDRLITEVLPAGQYVVLAFTDDVQVYPETNTMDVKTVQGSAGTYGVRLTESAPAPVVTSLTLSSGTVSAGKSVTGTYTLSAPAPAGGMMVDISSSHPYNVSPGSAFAEAGATTVRFAVSTSRSAGGLQATLTAWARVGDVKTANLTIRR